MLRRVGYLLGLMEDVCEKWSSLDLSEYHDDVLVVDDEEISDNSMCGEYVLLEKLLCNKKYNKKVLKAVIGGLWKTTGNIKTKDLEDDVICFPFDRPRDKRKVIDLRPWLFDRSLIILYDPSGREGNPPIFTHSEFWIQLHGLPILARTPKMGELLGKRLGTVTKVDKNKDGHCKDNFVRIRVNIDVTAPLRRGFHVQLGSKSEKTWIDVKYERLGDFCFDCGYLGHSWKFCPRKQQSRPGISSNIWSVAEGGYS